MHTLVQDGITPLTAPQMEAVVITIFTFLQEALGEGPIRLDHLVEEMRAPYNDWSPDVGRPPTQLEITSACCLLETRGVLRFDFIEGLMHVASVPCAARE